MPIFHLSFGLVVERKKIVHTGPVLHHAAYGGSQKILSKLLAQDVDITATDDHGMTALHWAVQSGRTAAAAATIQQLLDAGADICARDNCGRTALNWASFPPRFDKILRQAEGAAVAPEIAPAHMKNLTPLHIAARDGQSIEIAKLISIGIEPSLPDGIGMTALHWAARRGHVTVLQQLIAAGADIFALDKCGRSALQCAVEEREYGAVVLLAKEQLDACQQPDFSCPAELVSLLGRFVQEAALFDG
jgi:ankyrin repeat protein